MLSARWSGSCLDGIPHAGEERAMCGSSLVRRYSPSLLGALLSAVKGQATGEIEFIRCRLERICRGHCSIILSFRKIH